MYFLPNIVYSYRGLVMLNIIICEDENITRRRIEASLKEISIKHDLDIEISLSTDNPFDVYDYASKNKCDILLLDIDLKNDSMDGLELGNKLRTLDKNIIIVFISSRLEKIFACFTCNPFDFIPKPSINPHLEETILRIVENKLYTPHGHFVKIKNTVLNLDEIIYIEKQISKAIFYSQSTQTEIYISFIQLLDCLSDNFIQISKSFIINTDYIVDINISNKEITLNNGEVLKYSRKYANDMEEILNGKYINKY